MWFYHPFLFILLFFFIPNSYAQSGFSSKLETNEISYASSEISKEKMQEIKEEWDSLFPEDQPGEEELFRAERLLISATGSLKPLRLAPSVASVITAEEIEAMGATTLDEVLESVTGLHVVPSNFDRLNSLFSIRGILTRQNQQVLFLLNGVPVKLYFTGGKLNNFNMPTAAIARVEVVRGPGSAIHGADAFAGSVNVITKDAFDLSGWQTGMRAGSFGATENWLQYGGKSRGWDIGVSLDFLRNDGDTKRIVDSDVLTGTPNESVSLAPGQLETDDKIVDAHISLLKENWSIRFWTWMQEDGGIGAGAIQAVDPAGKQGVDAYLADVSYNTSDFFSDLDLTFRLSYFYSVLTTTFRLFPPGTVLPIKADGNIWNPADVGTPFRLVTFPEGVYGNPDAEEHVPAVDFVALYSGVHKHQLRFATGGAYLDYNAFEWKNFGPGVLDGGQIIQDGTVTEVSGTAAVFAPDNHRESFYVSLQDEWLLAPAWQLTAGLRYDYYSDFGYTINPRLALVWETRYDLTTKLLYGRAFRPPAFSQTSITNNPATIGNSALEPETINTYELAFDYQPSGKLRCGLNLFFYEIDGLIEAVPDPAPLTSNTFQHYKNQKGHGVEAELEWQMTRELRLNSSFAFQRSKDKATKEIVPYAPEIKASVGLHWDFTQHWSLNSQYYLIADRHRANGDSRPDIKDNDIVNMTLRRKNIGNNWDIALAVRNLFDEYVLEPATPSISNDYPMESRAFWAELRWHY